MSISDRLDEIEDDIPLAARSPEMAHHFTADHGPELLTALRAVLDVCGLIERAHEANPERTYEQGMEVAAHKMRTVIAAALGEVQP